MHRVVLRPMGAAWDVPLPIGEKYGCRCPVLIFGCRGAFSDPFGKHTVDETFQVQKVQ